MSANIDPYFSGYFVGAFEGDNGTSVEEAFVSHVGLIPGGTIKFGRFLSDFGYLNEIHAHAWDFVDAPLALQAFFGGQLKEDGLQARWVAPTSLLIELGVELGLGDQFPGTDRDKNGFNSMMVFAHLGGDVGFSNSYLVGATVLSIESERSHLPGSRPVRRAGDRCVHRRHRHVGTRLRLEVGARRQLGGAQLQTAGRVLPSQRERFADVRSGRTSRRDRQLQLRSERLVCAGGVSVHAALAIRRPLRPPRFRQHRHRSRSKRALPSTAFPILADHDPRRTTTMVDFSPSEFSRLRVQYAWDQARFTDTDDELSLQYIMSLGAHGAHKF